MRESHAYQGYGAVPWVRICTIKFTLYIEDNVMHAITYSSARQNLVETMEHVCDGHEPVIITRKNGRSVVMMSLDDYNAIEQLSNQR